MSKVDCTTFANKDGKLIGVSTEMEYMRHYTGNWITGTGTEITELGDGTYYVRVKATGTVLASENQSIKIRKPEATPTATFTATGADTGTLSGVESGMKYRIGSGGWTDIASDGDISLTGLTACTISVVRKGNGTKAITFAVAEAANFGGEDETI